MKAFLLRCMPITMMIALCIPVAVVCAMVGAA